MIIFDSGNLPYASKRCLENSESAKVREFKYLCRRDVWS